MSAPERPDDQQKRLRIGCPECSKPLNIQADFVGLKVRCRSCRVAFVVPEKIVRPCPHCSHDLRFRTTLLGRKMICRHCGMGFLARWAEPAELADDPIDGLHATDERVDALRAELKARTQQFAAALERLRRARDRAEKYKAAARALPQAEPTPEPEPASAAVPPNEQQPALADREALAEARTELDLRVAERDEACREVEDLRAALEALRARQDGEAKEFAAHRERVAGLDAEARTAREEAGRLREALRSAQSA